MNTDEIADIINDLNNDNNFDPLIVLKTREPLLQQEPSATNNQIKQQLQMPSNNENDVNEVNDGMDDIIDNESKNETDILNDSMNNNYNNTINIGNYNISYTTIYFGLFLFIIGVIYYIYISRKQNTNKSIQADAE